MNSILLTDFLSPPQPNTWHRVSKEYFEKHEVAIQFMFVSERDMLVWTLDTSNLLCCWQYTLSLRTGFGSFRPGVSFHLELDDVVLDVGSGDGTRKDGVRKMTWM
jgi:hypothetical protein